MDVVENLGKFIRCVLIFENRLLIPEPTYHRRGHGTVWCEFGASTTMMQYKSKNVIMSKIDDL